MKKFLLLICIVACTAASKGQDVRKASFGIKAGANFFTIKGEDYKDGGFKTKTGPHAGLFYQIPIAPLFSIQPELMYSSEGIKYEDEDLKALVHLNYLNLPVMFQFVTPSGFYAETGPQLGFVLKAVTKFEPSLGDKYEENIKEDINKVAFSWGFGAGYMIGRFGISGRYNLGLSNLPKRADDPQVEVPNDKSSGFQISLVARLTK